MIKIRKLEDHEKNKAYDVVNRAYENKRSISQWEWEFVENPLGRSLFVIAERGDRIIGTQAIILTPLNIKGLKILSAKSEETLVDKDYRGMAIFKEMYNLVFNEALQSGIEILWGFTSAIKAFQRIGFDIQSPLKSFWLVFSISKAFRYICIKQDLIKRNRYGQIIRILIGLIIIRFKFIIANMKKSRQKTNKMMRIKYELRELTDFNHETDLLFMNFIKDYPDIITIWRTKEYMNWRTTRNPHGHHRIIGILYKKEMVGYFVIAENTEANVLCIIDIIMLKKHASDGLSFLLDEIIALGKKEAIGYMTFDLVPSKNAYCELLKNNIEKNGFFQMPFSYPTIMKVISQDIDKDFVYDMNNWYINSIFTEGIL
jgi:hypothetical protein